MIPRLAEKLIQDRLRQFPAVVVVGPRQFGKTTRTKSLSTHYYDHEQEADRMKLDLGWDELTASDELVVLNEAHVPPWAFARLCGAIDARRQVKGRFLLPGTLHLRAVRQRVPGTRVTSRHARINPEAC